MSEVQNAEYEVENDNTGAEISEELESIDKALRVEFDRLSATSEEGETPKLTMGIGQFVRHVMLHSEKTNKEILELVHSQFGDAKTTMACIAWYKSDLRKKGLLTDQNARSKTKAVRLTADELRQLIA